jgi:hypothetical protein
MRANVPTNFPSQNMGEERETKKLYAAKASKKEPTTMLTHTYMLCDTMSCTKKGKEDDI